ncbi:hypothetical protein J4232_06190 [Candidatus Woesearchaeota archaeon]|nr:hypothetical protein [Candidatus Woesearchaeota archaeon]
MTISIDYANKGDVMSIDYQLNNAEFYAEKIGKGISADIIAKIKIIGYAKKP